MTTTEVRARRADAPAGVAAGVAADGTDGQHTRRALLRRRDAQRRRMARLRRTVFVSLLALTGGAVVARAAQDPAVALPRPAAGSPAAARVAPPPVPAALPTAAALPSPRSTVVPSTELDGYAEGGEPEPTAAGGAGLAPVPESAAGTVSAVDVPRATFASSGRTVHVSIEIEDGLGAEAKDFAATVANVLSDARGWQTADGVRFVPVSAAQVRAGADVDIRVTLATPTLTAKLCAPLRVEEVKVSCWNKGRAVLNLHRWVRGAVAYGPDLAGYRTYLINHEVGHGLGHGHVNCAGAGRPAGIMVQQTLGLGGCTPWSWPTKP